MSNELSPHLQAFADQQYAAIRTEMAESLPLVQEMLSHDPADTVWTLLVPYLTIADVPPMKLVMYVAALLVMVAEQEQNGAGR